MSGANPHRGEAELTVDGAKLVLRPTFGALPANYHLTFSYAGPENLEAAIAMLDRGISVAVVFDTPRGKDLPGSWGAARVIDGDKHDLRFLDPPGVVVGLRAKGRARNDDSGFVVKVAA